MLLAYRSYPILFIIYFNNKMKKIEIMVDKGRWCDII